MRIFLTGATGFLGSHGADRFSERGHQLSTLVRKSSHTDHLRSLGVTLVEGALPNAGRLAPALAGLDAVVHVAGAVQAKNRAEFLAVNEMGTRHLVQEALAADPPPKFFLHISTIAVHRPNAGNHFTLQPEECRPLSHYGESKRRAELALRDLSGKIPYAILRPPVLYGPRDREFLPLFKAVRFGIAPLLGRGRSRLSACYGPDVAEAMVRLTENPPPDGTIFTLDDGGIHTWRDLARAIGQAVGKSPTLLPCPKWLYYLAAAGSELKIKITGRPDVFTLNKMRELTAEPWVCGREKLKQHLNWVPMTPLLEGMRLTWRDYQEQGLFS